MIWLKHWLMHTFNMKIDIKFIHYRGKTMGFYHSMVYYDGKYHKYGVIDRINDYHQVTDYFSSNLDKIYNKGMKVFIEGY